MATYQEKRVRLQANRAALVQQHATLTEQLTQTSIGIHQIDGALAVLNELAAEATPVSVAASNGATITAE